MTLALAGAGCLTGAPLGRAAVPVAGCVRRAGVDRLSAVASLDAHFPGSRFSLAVNDHATTRGS
jgi:hypothetical protein